MDIFKYKDPLLNRERRVKELFKSFEDISDDEIDDDEIDDEKSLKNRRISKRESQVIDSFNALDKAKKEWLKERGRLFKIQK